MASVFDLEVLRRKWIHSHEEDHDNEMVFRSSNHKFLPSRGRTSFELGDGGELMIGGPGHDDRQTKKSGDWKLENNALIFSQGGMVTRTLRIMSLNSDKLVVTEG